MDYPEAVGAGAASEPARARLSVRAARWLGWALWVVAAAQTAFALVLAAMNRLTLSRFFAEYVVSQTAATLAFATVGVLTASRRPGNTIGWLFGRQAAGRPTHPMAVLDVPFRRC